MKSGFAVIIGRSNVGKSTLLNSLIGTKIAITTPKPQTTRLPLHGVYNDDRGQIVFVDTPGVMQKAGDLLTQSLLRTVKDSLRDIDAIVYVADPTREIGNEEKQTLKLIEKSETPKVLVINKIDNPASKNYIDFYRDLGESTFSHTIEVSAKERKNINWLVDWIFRQMPEGEPFYGPDQISNISKEDQLAELIREKLFLRLRQEVPYSVHVEVKEILERENGMMYVEAVIYTTEERYKRMIIGKGGRGIKEIGQSTRKELEAVTERSFYLDLTVEVDAHWAEKLK